jgi:uncharacterized protein YoxC
MVKRNEQTLKSQLASTEHMIERKRSEIQNEVDAQANRVHYMQQQIQQSTDRSTKLIKKKREMIEGWEGKCALLKALLESIVENGQSADDASEPSDGSGYTEQLRTEALTSIGAEQDGSSEPQSTIRVEE